MKFKLLLHLCLLFAGLTMITSCEYGWIDFEQPDEPGPGEEPVEISFADEIIPIFDSNCNVTGCHTAGHFAVDLTPDNAWQDIQDKGMLDLETPENSKLYTKIAQPGTHDGRSLPIHQQKILQWITEGAKNN